MKMIFQVKTLPVLLQRFALVTATFLLIFSTANAQIVKSEIDTFTVAFYNVENLFDTINDPAISDTEFLPEAEKQWTEKRYHKKLSNLAKVIAAIPSPELPDLVGLCEVENKMVVLDLTKQQEISNAGYQIVHNDSPDRRGIDVALLYKPGHFSVLKHQSFTAPLVTSGNPTRDVLYVTGVARKTDTLHIFVNHWPSRYGGVEKSAPNRNAIAKLVRTKIDSLQQADPDAKIVVMGDFNDNPDDTSVEEILGGATIPEETEKPLYNLHSAAYSRGEGTFNYKGTWSMLDQILVSWSLRDSATGLHCPADAGGILREPWMIYTSKKGVEYPNKTYGGPSYYGGYSDHLPVYATFQYIY